MASKPTYDEIRPNVRVAVHAFDGITMFHLAAPLLVFGELSRMDPPIQWPTTVWTETGAGVRTAEGVRVEEVSGPRALENVDLLVFPSWPTDLPPAHETLTTRIRRAHDHGAQIAGLCLGAFPVVDSGLLHGRSAVTHWAMLSELERRNPYVVVDHSALYLDHGDVLTSAGTASAIDACLHIVRHHLGASIATALSRRLVVAPHRDGDQAQYVDRPITEPGGVGSLGPTLQWAMTHLDEKLALAQLAEHARMSRRNFTRRFAEATGTTPAKWVLARRLDESRRLLETTPWPITRIAHACGFTSPITFRQNFTTAYATTPTSYRQRFA